MPLVVDAYFVNTSGFREVKCIIFESLLPSKVGNGSCIQRYVYLSTDALIYLYTDMDSGPNNVGDISCVDDISILHLYMKD